MKIKNSLIKYGKNLILKLKAMIKINKELDIVSINFLKLIMAIQRIIISVLKA